MILNEISSNARDLDSFIFTLVIPPLSAALAAQGETFRDTLEPCRKDPQPSQQGYPEQVLASSRTLLPIHQR